MNFVSGALGTSSVAILLCVVSVAVLAASHRWKSSKTENEPARSGGVLDAAVFYLGSFAIGTIISGLSVIPLFPDRTFQLQLPEDVIGSQWLAPFHGYELLSVSLIVALAVIAVLRRQGLYRVLTFTVSGVAGASFVISAVLPENDFVLTFVGWALGASIVVVLVTLAPALVRSMAAFWRIGAIEPRQLSTPQFANEQREGPASEDAAADGGPPPPR
ncbi:MAG: hypothetical protein K0S37_3876 [Microbacterium sp.]|nr:hypothetical protein [Microbacterium sp.]